MEGRKQQQTGSENLSPPSPPSVSYNFKSYVHIIDFITPHAMFKRFVKDQFFDLW